MEQVPEQLPLVKARFDLDEDEEVKKAKASAVEIKEAQEIVKNDDYLAQDEYALKVIRNGGVTEVKGEIVIFNLSRFIAERRRVHLAGGMTSAAADKVVREAQARDADSLSDFESHFGHHDSK
ncbi:hypothetical protein HY414_01570 [Candidatus Kaiserbacteria bacterium]|nr:hypothetical protein [Candidatus Kaiserbacteria bacterium]